MLLKLRLTQLERVVDEGIGDLHSLGCCNPKRGTHPIRMVFERKDFSDAP